MTPTFTPSLIDACAYTLTIEAKPSDDSSDYATIGAGDYTWITNGGTGFEATVLETDYASFSEPVDYTIRWHYVITDTTESSLTTDAYDYATLTMVDQCYYNELTIETYQPDIDSILSADDSNSAVSGSNWISSSVGTCANSDSGADANGNNCASYDSGTCTDCLCDASDDAGSFTYADCCACGGGSKPTVCALT